jgi:hypothetical protein
VGVCFKGQNFTVSDPNSLVTRRPSVLSDCEPSSQSLKHVVSPPENLQVSSASKDSITISWEETSHDIHFFRLFLQEKNSVEPSVTLETADSKNFYVLQTPPRMQGGTFSLTVQAINRQGKMS